MSENENVIRLDESMTKVQLIRHLNADHTQAAGLITTEPPVTDMNDIPEDELQGLHELIHIGIGR